MAKPENTQTTDMKGFWEDAHIQDKKYELTGSSAEGVLKFLNITDKMIRDSKTCLVIGVGFGHETYFFAKNGLQVSVLDISSKALKRVAQITQKQYLPDQLPEVPSDHFDLIVSHLVTQHMNNKDLADQINNCIRALKPDGTFAMQFSSRRKTNSDNMNQPIRASDQMAGFVCRSPRFMESLVRKNGGKITWQSWPIYFPHIRLHWYGVHIKKLSSREEKSGLLSQLHWFVKFAIYYLKAAGRKISGRQMQ